MITYPPPPFAPVDMTVPAGNSRIALAALGVVGIGGLAWAMVDGVRRGNVLFLAVFLGGLATALLEPFADLLGFVWFPVHDQVNAFTMLGIPIPLFVVIGYTNLFGLVPWIFLRMLQAQPDRRRYWTVSGGLLLAACVFEWLLLRTGAYTYYGPQPLQVWGYPMIWMTINTGACLLAALVIRKLPELFTGARALTAIALVPCCDGAVLTGTGWPAFAGMHADPSPLVLHLLGLVTIGFGLSLYALGARLCCAGTPSTVGVPAPRAAQRVQA